MKGGCKVAIVADDLTGALDAAAPFAERGLATRVAITLEALDATLAAGAALPDVIAVNTGSRHLSSEDAAQRVVQAADRLLACRPRLLIKKVDSTLRGQVVGESLALRQLAGRRLLVSPAVPSQGRVIRGAEVFVDGEPLSATSYARDELSAPLSGPLDTRFTEYGLPMVRHVAQPGAVLPQQDCVVDAEDDASLEHVAANLLKATDAWLPVGAAGLTRALAQCLAGAPRAVRLPAVQRILLTVGSRSPRAQRQLAWLHDAFPAIPRLRALAASEVPDAAQGVLLVIPGVPNDVAPSAEEVAGAIAGAVARLTASQPGSLLFLSGGDIAMAVLERVEGRFIDLRGEWCPGVPFGYIDGDTGRPVMTKAGGFGQDDTLASLVKTIRHSSKG